MTLKLSANGAPLLSLSLRRFTPGARLRVAVGGHVATVIAADAVDFAAAVAASLTLWGAAPLLLACGG